ncbi:MAG: hypothetical protein C4295_12185, partial [Candidatus Fervidibacterota bacterium]
GGVGGPYQWCGLWGYRNDHDGGLMHVGARYYEVETGRWVQKDKIISLHSSLNYYLYVINNPINLIDPSGYDWSVLIEFGKELVASGYIGLGLVLIGCGLILLIVDFYALIVHFNLKRVQAIVDDPIICTKCEYNKHPDFYWPINPDKLNVL